MIDNIIHIGLRHKLLAFIIAVSVCALGVYSLSRLSIDAFPDISPNLVQVFAEVDGMAPEEVEQLVTRPTETAMRNIPGVQKIRSLSSLGLSTVNIYFEDDVDIFLARQLVSERLKLAEEGIPKGIDMPHGLEMGPVASGMGKILAYYLQADGHDITEVRTLHEWVVKRGVETVPGVAKVVSQGGFMRQYEVELSPEKLLSHRLTASEVGDAIRLNNANSGAGLITSGSEELIVRTLGRVSTVDEISNTVVKTVDGKPVLVKDLGRVQLGGAFRRGVAVMNGQQEVVLGGIYKIHRANSFEVIQALQERIDEINESLPTGIRVVPYYDQSDLVSSSIKTVRNALILGLVLVSLIAFLFLGNVRNALIMVCSLPFALLFGITLMEWNGIPGDLISLGGMAIALGMIIDATIIMVEKLQTAAGKPATREESENAILKAAQEVGRPIVFAVAVICVVFLPIFTLGEVEGKMFRPLAFAVVATMIGSLLYALLVAPIFFRIMHRFDHKRSGHGPGRMLEPLLDRYEILIRKTLGHPYRLVIILIALLGSGVFGFMQLGREFVPVLQEGTINCYAYMNPNVSLDEIQKVCTQISRTAKEIPEIENIIADIGYGEVGPHMHHTNYGCITITLKPRRFGQKQRSQQEVVAALDEKLNNILGVTVGFSQPIAHEVDGLISGAGAQVVMKIFGDDMAKLGALGAKVEQVVSGVDGVADLQVEQTDGQTQMQLQLDAIKLARYGLNKHEVQSVVHQALTGEIAGEIFEGERSSRILVRLDKRYQENRDKIVNLPILTPAGSYVPLGNLASVKTLTGLRQISRENTQRYISVQCNVRGRDVGSFVQEAQRAVDNAAILPSGYRIAWGGQFELQQAANRRLAIVVPITLVLVLCMLYALFNSIPLALLIMLNVPLALVGGILSLAAFRENISIPSSIGFIALFGIALTDGVVLVSRIETLRKEGAEMLDAIISACRTKFRPVLMTTVTTALGLLPLIIASGTGSEVQRPLAIVVVFGLFTSTIVTLFILPAAYIWMAKKGMTSVKQDAT
ncbi:Cobalt-zinc-cadmium resistance protein CzcA [Pontiella desulfatans]|uniref:Cobalt-zinc-cadmium resistance protein CzcA n=1 Tax=Pontiella desulfatans TaxID=2750659 RepID=A0A6C2U7R9_PONDE|nr:CusA/CzcA family heavy metal efflux RND transporter [Pontiella desulfatans]VGO15873.1 Cobalt-zinc-cadmium resistance protein CzcA [Pontiella desulfatans]